MRSIEEKLKGNGLIIRENRLKGRSLSRADRGIILRVRSEAIAAGKTRHAINGLEMRGDRGEWGYRAKPYEAVFRGLQETGHGWHVRLYDIIGDHPLNNSTVCMMTLVHKGIYPYDLNPFRVAFEYLKETILLIEMQVSMVLYDIFARWKK